MPAGERRAKIALTPKKPSMPINHPVLHAAPGDRLVIRGHHVGEPERDAEILEVLGDDGGPPFLVCWQDDGRVSRLYPSSDAYVEHFEHETADR
jgi:uncharacterized protein DUF1918